MKCLLRWTQKLAETLLPLNESLIIVAMIPQLLLHDDVDSDVY